MRKIVEVYQVNVSDRFNDAQELGGWVGGWVDR